jgi:hypothetical protein
MSTNVQVTSISRSTSFNPLKLDWVVASSAILAGLCLACLISFVVAISASDFAERALLPLSIGAIALAASIALMMCAVLRAS